jgi:hypothetical protein
MSGNMAQLDFKLIEYPNLFNYIIRSFKRKQFNSSYASMVLSMFFSNLKPDKSNNYFFFFITSKDHGYICHTLKQKQIFQKTLIINQYIYFWNVANQLISAFKNTKLVKLFWWMSIILYLILNTIYVSLGISIVALLQWKVSLMHDTRYITI